MGIRAFLTVVFSLELRAFTLQHAHDDHASSGKKVLVIDIRGPTRETGDGVRVMGMLMDLQACGHHVEVLSDAADYFALKKSWPHSVSMTYFSGVHFWEAAKTMPEQFKLSTFSRIIIGAKLDLLYTDGTQGLAVPFILSALKNETRHRQKVVAFWDDVPFERCRLRPEADKICPRVPAVVKDIAQVAHKFYMLSADDKDRMTKDMVSHGIPMGNLNVSIWPMRIANMQKVLLHQPFKLNRRARNLVVMMGNLHAVNKFMVTMLFQSGVVSKICSEISRRSSNIRLVFMGGLADVAQEQKKSHSDGTWCADVRTGYTDDKTLKQTIYPHTRAILNPFFKDVNSGISVKNFESIMSGVPFLTSEFGMHGLSDEIHDCATFPMPAKPGDPADFSEFIIDNVVDDKGYSKFARRFAQQSSKCIAGQLRRYPIEAVC